MSAGLLFLATLAAGPAFAGPLRDPVLAQLDGVEDPPSLASLQALGEGVGPELLELAQDKSLLPTRRARATQALGHFPSEDARAFLVTTLAGGEPILARKAAWALAHGWGDEAVEWLAPALTADDVQLRLAGCRALGSLGSERARSALQARLAQEQNPAVKDLIRQSLAR